MHWQSLTSGKSKCGKSISRWLHFSPSQIQHVLQKFAHQYCKYVRKEPNLWQFAHGTTPQRAKIRRLRTKKKDLLRIQCTAGSRTPSCQILIFCNQINQACVPYTTVRSYPLIHSVQVLKKGHVKMVRAFPRTIHSQLNAKTDKRKALTREEKYVYSNCSFARNLLPPPTTRIGFGIALV